MEVPELKGRMRDLFGITPRLILKLKYQIKNLYANSKIRNIAPELLHKIAINLFANDYFAITSRNIRIDKFTNSIIMGGVAYNMNVPQSMPFLKLDTDDIDLKIYTTDINYLEKNEKAVNRVLSILRFTVIIICMYSKQILELIKIITKEIHEDSNKNKTQWKSNKDKIKKDKTKKDKTKGNIKFPKYLTKKIHNKKQRGGAPVKYGTFLNDYNIFVQIKKKNEDNVNEVIEKIDLSKMSYADIFSTIMTKIDNPDLLITNKISYNIQYADGKIHSKYRAITFSDTKIIYPNKENPAFYAQYLMNNPKIQITIMNLTNSS